MPKIEYKKLLKRALEFDSGVHFVRPMLMAVMVGAGTGCFVVAFIKALTWANDFFFSPAIKNSLWVILVPVAGGLMVGPLVTFLAPEAKGHGVPEVLKAIALRGAKIRPIVAVVKTVASIISIGSGFSVGREGRLFRLVRRWVLRLANF